MTRIKDYIREVMKQNEARKIALTAPDEAFTNADHEVDNDWLASLQATELHIKDAMRRWFLARFCHPAQAGYDYSDQTGYLFLDGGPFNAQDEIFNRFQGYVDDSLIAEVCEELVQESGEYWAPTALMQYRQDEDVDVDERSDVMQRLDFRISRLHDIMQLEGDFVAETAARNLIYAAVFSALETFLWETLVYWIEVDERVMRNLLSKHPVFKAKTFSYDDILDSKDPVSDAKLAIRTHLQNVVWHRWERVSKLYSVAFRMEFPDPFELEGPLEIRHDIVHRSGVSAEAGQERIVSWQEVQDLCRVVMNFANLLEKNIAEAFVNLDKPQQMNKGQKR
ncbi:hypothetical protein [Stenotrophomonas muris]|uniref:hypothetical protein n=1 Tax=Stenotrophomonas muris TaxID=2963283 RepID=UPI00300E7676